MTILIKAGTGLLAGVVAGALGLAFLPRMQPNGLTPRAAVGHPQFVAAVSPEAAEVARSATTVAVPLAAAPAKPAPAAEAKAATTPSPEAEPAAPPVVLAKLDPPKPAPAPAAPAPAPSQAPAPAASVAETQAVAAPVSPAAAPIPSSANEASARWSVRGLVALAKGDLSSARLYLTRAADAGDPRAWVALADTYDQVMLTKLGVVGAPGDPKRAKDYLQKAADAGLVVAKNRMAALDSGESNVRQ